MNKARTFPAASYTALKAATGTFYGTAFGNETQAAPHTRVGQQTLSAYANRANPKFDEHFIPADVLLDLTRASGDTSLLRYIAEQVDCLLVPLPTGLAGAVAESTGRSAKEFGDVMVRIGEAVRDGQISEPEGRVIASEIREAMLELSALAEAVKAATVRDEE